MAKNKTTLFASILFVLIALTYLLLNIYFDVFNLPYFWDELGVYSRAAIHMSVHGIGLLPSVLPDDISRGHPILVPFLFSTVFKIFGLKIIVARLFAAFIYSVGIFYLFRIFLLKYSPFHATIFSFLIFIQPCFLSQSLLILPEIPLMVIAIMSLFYFLKKQYSALSICLSISLFVKESAIILPLTIYALDFLYFKFNWRNLIVIIISICFNLFFFCGPVFSEGLCVLPFTYFTY